MSVFWFTDLLIEIKLGTNAPIAYCFIIKSRIYPTQGICTCRNKTYTQQNWRNENFLKNYIKCKNTLQCLDDAIPKVYILTGIKLISQQSYRSNNTSLELSIKIGDCELEQQDKGLWYIGVIADHFALLLSQLTHIWSSTWRTFKHHVLQPSRISNASRSFIPVPTRVSSKP